MVRRWHVGFSKLTSISKYMPDALDCQPGIASHLLRCIC